jgi:threonine dehydratase
MNNERPTLKGVFEARKRISPYLTKTPLVNYPRLSKVAGFEIYVKHENLQPTGAFKIRGGINLVSQLSPEDKRKGVITASTGNHGQSIALASKMFGVKTIVCVQEHANPDKVEAIRMYGADIIAEGNDFDEARVNSERIGKERGMRYVHSANETHLIEGVATAGLEILEDLPDVDAIFVPVGGGTMAAGLAIVFKSIRPEVKIFAVQAENAPSVFMSWKSGKLESTESASTIADGLATRQAFKLTVPILRELVDDFILVSEDEIKDAVRLYVEKAHTIAEGAGAAPLAACLKVKASLKGKKVVLILSGGNIPLELLKSIL